MPSTPKKSLRVVNVQKDDVGWSGAQPKLNKGPDLLVAVLAKIEKDEIDLTVDLVGPGRSYVRTHLDDLSIGYTHHQNIAPSELKKIYSEADIYLCASRIEGGPLGPFEAWLNGALVVSTPVGMVVDYRHLDGFYVSRGFGVDDISQALSQATFAIGQCGTETLLSRRGALQDLTERSFASAWLDILTTSKAAGC